MLVVNKLSMYGIELEPSNFRTELSAFSELHCKGPTIQRLTYLNRVINHEIQFKNMEFTDNQLKTKDRKWCSGPACL